MVQLLTNLDVMREMHRQKIGLINHFMRNESLSGSGAMLAMVLRMLLSTLLSRT